MVAEAGGISGSKPRGGGLASGPSDPSPLKGCCIGLSLPGTSHSDARPLTLCQYRRGHYGSKFALQILGTNCGVRPGEMGPLYEQTNQACLQG